VKNAFHYNYFLVTVTLEQLYSVYSNKFVFVICNRDCIIQTKKKQFYENFRFYESYYYMNSLLNITKFN
jgi:proteasome assembly chaperone (PAC2) family protein